LLKESLEAVRAERTAACESAVFGDKEPTIAWHKNGYLEACQDMKDMINGGD